MKNRTYAEFVLIAEGKKKELRAFQAKLEAQFHRGRADAVAGGAKDIDPEGAKKRAKKAAKKLASSKK